MSKDYESIAALLGDDVGQLAAHPTKFKSYTWRALPDINQGNYQDGRVRFDTISYQTSWVDWHHAYLNIPFTINSDGSIAAVAALNAQSNVTIKNGLIQLIGSIVINLNGTTFQNASDINMINHLRSLLEMSIAYAQSIGGLYFYAKDSLNPTTYAGVTPTIPLTSQATEFYSPAVGAFISVAGVLTGATTVLSYENNTGAAIAATGAINVPGFANLTSVAGVAAGAVSAVSWTNPVGQPTVGAATQIPGFPPGFLAHASAAAGATVAVDYISPSTVAANGALLADSSTVRNPDYDSGFSTRIGFTNPNFTPGIGFTFFANIPLRLLTMYFDNLRAPLKNARFLLDFGITGLAGGTSHTNAIVHDAVSPNCTLRIGITNTVNGVLGQLNSRLYLPVVELTPEVDIIVSKRFLAGKGISAVTFWDTKTIQNSTPGITNASNVGYTINNGIAAPKRVWINLYPYAPTTAAVAGLYNAANTLTGQVITANTLSGVNAQMSFAPCVATGQLTNVNLKLANSPLFPDALVYDYQMYELYKEEFFNAADSFQSGSLVSFQDWKTSHRYHCFNISRFLESTGQDPTKTVSIDLVAQRAEVVPPYCDLWSIIEYEKTVILDMTTSLITVINNV